jgi:ABC-type sugar transport system ATPase subunit
VLSPDHTPVLAARDLRKHFGGVAALSAGNIELEAGEVHALVGDNGAGKSTFLKILSGALQPDGGTVYLDGQQVQPANPKAARQLGIATVFQELALVNHLDAGANIFLGHEILKPWPLKLFGVLDRRAMRTRATAEVRRLKVGIRSVDQLVMGMSGGQRQSIAVARAVAFGSRIIIMDEPTAALGVRETGAALELIKQLRANGLAVLVISHSLPEVFEVADRITVMRLGRTLKTVHSSQTNLTEIVAMMTGAHDIGWAS